MNATSFRLSAAFILLFGVTATVLFFYVTSMSTGLLLSQTREAVEEQVTQTRDVFRRGGIPALFRFVERQARQPGASLYLIADLSGRIIAGNVSALEPGVLDHPGWRARPFIYQRIQGEPDQQYRAVAAVIRMPNNLTLLIGRDVGEPERFRTIIRQSLILTLIAMAIGGLAIWFLIGRRALKRLDAVSNTTRNIMSGDLSQRLPVAGTGGEFDRLSEALNGLIARLEHLNSGVRDVSDNVAHDLKTPLTRMRNRADRALTTASDESELRAALEANIQDSDKLIATFNAILRISKLEAGTLLESKEAVDLGRLAQDVAELFEPSADDIGARIDVKVDGPVTLAGNRELLAQTLANLIENALHHGMPAEGGLVVIEARQRPGGGAILAVRDNGPGIPAEERERAMARFGRLEKSRTTPGTGLGLSLVQAIVSAHGGTVELDDAAPGLIVRMVFDRNTTYSARNGGSQTVP